MCIRDSIDIDPSSISKRVRVDVPIVGNVADVLEEMIKLLKSEKSLPEVCLLYTSRCV